MREIKFRAWEPGQFPKMIPSEGITLWNGKHWDAFGDCEIKGCILMQYTGLKDKAGKEIYEGDIVKCGMSYKGGSLPHMGEIVYMEAFGAFATKNLSGETLLHNHLLNTFEITGNIYDNPELIQ